MSTSAINSESVCGDGPTSTQNLVSSKSTKVPHGPPRQDKDNAFDYLVDGSGEQEGLFPSGEVNLIVGASGAGKTTWLLQFILSLRNGDQFFGRRTNPKPYVFISYDRSLNGIRRTCKRMNIDLNDLHLLRPTDEEAQLPLLELLEKVALKHKDVKVLFIEGLDMLVPQGKTSDLTAVTKFLDKLQRLAQKHGLTIIGSVGSPKMKATEKYQSPRDCIFGSVGWGRKVETIIYMEQQNANEPNSLRQLWILPRNGKEEKHVFRWQDGRLIEAQDQGRETTEQRAMKWIEENLKPGEDFRLMQVSTALNAADSTTQSALDRLVKQKQIAKPRHGHYQRPLTGEGFECFGESAFGWAT